MGINKDTIREYYNLEKSIDELKQLMKELLNKKIDNPIFFISYKETVVKFLHVTYNKIKENDIHIHNTIKDAYEDFKELKPTIQNSCIFLVDDTISKVPIKYYLQVMREFFGDIQILVFSTNANSAYAKDVMQGTADDFFQIPPENAVSEEEIRSYYIHLLEALDQAATRSRNHILNPKTTPTAAALTNLCWKNALIQSVNERIKAIYLKECAIQDQQDQINTREFVYGRTLDELKDQLLKDTKIELPAHRIPIILAVDDEEDIRKQIYLALKKDYQVLQAENGKIALEALEKVPIDIVLLDILLNDIRGTDLIPKIKEINPKVDIIMLTAYQDISFITESMRGGVFDFLHKSACLEDIKAKIFELSEKRYYEEIFDTLIHVLEQKRLQSV